MRLSFWRKLGLGRLASGAAMTEQAKCEQHDTQDVDSRVSVKLFESDAASSRWIIDAKQFGEFAENCERHG